MSTVAIVSNSGEREGAEYLAAAGPCHAVGDTAGQALDALTARLGDFESGSLIVVQCFRPDSHFGADQQARLGELIQRWRGARDAGQSLSAEDQTELERLIDEEVRAAGQRAADAAEGLDR